MKRLFITTLTLLLLAFASPAQTNLDSLMAAREEYFFTLTMDHPEEVHALTRLCSIDSRDGLVLTCYANPEQYHQLLEKGYQPTLLTPPSLQQTFAMWDGSHRDAFDWDTYPTYEAYCDMMRQFAEEHPDRCTYMELGTLDSGRKLLCCRLNIGQPDGKPKFLYTSTIHGDELTGMMLMLRLLDELTSSNDPRILRIINNLDLFISPNTNPDGTYHGGNHTVSGARRTNANNADLNRNYPDFDDGPHPDGRPYQPETLMMMDLADQYPFTMAANFHGGAEVLNYPWDTYQPLHADDDWWRHVCREYADLVHQHDTLYMSIYDDGIVNGYVWYPIYGSRQDYMNYYQHCRELTIECSAPYTPNPSTLPMYWTYNHESMLCYLEQCLNGIHGTVTDADTGEPLAADITIANHDHHGSAVSSHLPAGDYHRPIKGGTYEVTYSSRGYLPQTHLVTVNDNEAVTLDVHLSKWLSTLETLPETPPHSVYRLTNLLGQTIKTGVVGDLNLSELPSGIYFLVFDHRTQKIVIQR